MKCDHLALTGCASLILVAFSGCGKIPTWGEIIGQSKPAPVNQPVTTVNQGQQKPAPPAPEPPPEDVIARFNALGAAQKSDQLLLQLTSLKSGLDTVTEINADGSQLTTNGMAFIDRLTGLKQLRLNRTKMDDAVCQKIALLSALEVLAIAETEVTDAGVAALSALSNLKHLELSKCRLTESGFRANCKRSSSA